MRTNYIEFSLEETIPARQYLRNKKLVKYFNRETSAGIVCLAGLLSKSKIESDTPFYYETGLVEYENFGLDSIVDACEEDGLFSQKAFVEKGMSSISPLTQFKILLNMPASFISIDNGITGENAIIYSSASGLVIQALNSDCNSDILVGAGKVFSDGKVASGFAIVTKSELSEYNNFLYSEKEGIELLQEMHRRTNG